MCLACCGAVEAEAESTRFTCHHCHMDEMKADCEWDHAEPGLRALLLVMVLQTVVVVRGTTVTQWRQLRGLLKDACEDLSMPCLTDSLPRLKAFMCWLLTHGYHRSMDTYTRGLGSMLGEPAITWLKSPSILHVINRAHREHGEEHKAACCIPVKLVLEVVVGMDMDPTRSPRTACVRFMSSLLLNAVLLARFMLGLRPGETGESTGAHHLLCKNVFLGSHDVVGTFVDVRLDHCKTANVPWKVAAIGESASGLPLYYALDRYAQCVGFKRLCCNVEGNPGHIYDSHCIRIALCNASVQQIKEAALLLPHGHGGGVPFLLEQAAQRSQNAHVERRYVNIARGTFEECQEFTKILLEAGIPAERFSTTGCPFFLRLHNGGFTAMPMDAAWASRGLKVILTAVAAGMGMELEGDPTGHGARRGGTQAAKARIAAGTSKATEEDIDLHFRWRLRELLRKMQVHYSGIRPLLQRLQVTIPI
jgi:hypothetical protein